MNWAVSSAGRKIISVERDTLSVTDLFNLLVLKCYLVMCVFCAGEHRGRSLPHTTSTKNTGWAAATELCEPSWLICEAMAPSCGQTQGDMHGIREICSLCWQIYNSARIHLIRLLNVLFSDVCVFCWENTGAEAFNNWVRGTKCVRCGNTAYVLFLTTAPL